VHFIKYYSGDHVKNSEIGWSCTTHEIDEKCLQNFGGKPDGKTPLGKPRLRWKNYIRMNLREEQR
jgi:hypothetical protein